MNEKLRDIKKNKSGESKLKSNDNKLRTSLWEAITALTSLAERDPYTAGHQERVAHLACAIASEMGLSKNKIESIRTSGIVHDIGNVYLPGKILTKPGCLTEIEFELIKLHPAVGWDILRTIDFPWPVAEIVHQHHERLDGSGYPRGLKGKDILLEAKVLAVADVVEAISSRRSYRKSLGIKEAIKEIKNKRGILYEPSVVDACIEVVSDKEYFSNYRLKNRTNPCVKDKNTKQKAS